MSKPDKPGELRDVEVEAVSLVNKAANRKRFKIFKNDKSVTEPVTEPEEVKKNTEPEADEGAPDDVVKNDTQGLSHEEVEKGAVANIVEGQENGAKLNQATEALFQVLGLSKWGERTKEGPETDPAKIRAALTDFKAVAEKILLGKDEDLKKAVEEVQKSGRKISAPRLAKIKEVYAMLGDLIAETDSEGEVIEMNKEEIVSAVKESVDEALKPINERLEALEKSEEAAPADPAPETPDIGMVVKEAVEKAVEPIAARLEKVEKARGFSNRQPDETSVQKEENDAWAGIF